MVIVPKTPACRRRFFCVHPARCILRSCHLLGTCPASITHLHRTLLHRGIPVAKPPHTAPKAVKSTNKMVMSTNIGVMLTSKRLMLTYKRLMLTNKGVMLTYKSYRLTHKRAMLTLKSEKEIFLRDFCRIFAVSSEQSKILGMFFVGTCCKRMENTRKRRL